MKLLPCWMRPGLIRHPNLRGNKWKSIGVAHEQHEMVGDVLMFFVFFYVIWCDISIGIQFTISLSRWPTFKLWGITYFLGTTKFQLGFHSPLAEWTFEILGLADICLAEVIEVGQFIRAPCHIQLVSFVRLQEATNSNNLFGGSFMPDIGEEAHDRSRQR